MGSNRRGLERYLALRWQDRQQAQSNSARVFEHLVLRQVIEEKALRLGVVTGQQTPRLVIIEGSEDL
jgi:hypothetical protein